MSRETVLLWDRRLVCGGCGRSSHGHGIAGEMVATPDGWRCPRCVELAQIVSQPVLDEGEAVL